MSTENIHALIAAVKKDWPDMGGAADRALLEIDAIERAAHMVTMVGQSEAAVERYEEWKAACELLRSIDKEGS